MSSEGCSVNQLIAEPLSDPSGNLGNIYFSEFFLNTLAVPVDRVRRIQGLEAAGRKKRNYQTN